MAKSQRSSRKKALRTQRAEKVSATWQAEADAKRLAALAKCVEAAPVPIVSSIPPADDDKEEQKRGRSGASAAAAAAGEGAAMAVDGEQQQSGKKTKKGKKGGPAAKGVAKKRGKKTAQVRLAAEFSKKRKRMRR